MRPAVTFLFLSSFTIIFVSSHTHTHTLLDQPSLVTHSHHHLPSTRTRSRVQWQHAFPLFSLTGSLQSGWIPPSLSAARMDQANTRPSGSLKRAREPSPSPGSGRAGQPLTPSPTEATVTQVVGQVPNGPNSVATGSPVWYVTSALEDQPAFNRVYANNSMMYSRPNPFSIPPQPSQPGAIHAIAATDQPLDKQTQTEQPVQHSLDYPCTHNGQSQAVQHQLCDHAACQLRLAPDPRLASFHPACLTAFEVVNNNRFRVASALSISTDELYFDELYLTFNWAGMESESSNTYNKEKLEELRADYPAHIFMILLPLYRPPPRTLYWMRFPMK